MSVLLFIYFYGNHISNPRNRTENVSHQGTVSNIRYVHTKIMTGIQERNILTALLEEHIAKFRLRLHSDVNQYNKRKTYNNTTAFIKQ
jgi:hypothetical protein